MNTIARHHTLKYQLRLFMIVSISFVAVALVTHFVQNYRAIRVTSTASSSLRAGYSSTPASPGGSSPRSQPAREQKNPFQGFRNVSSLP
jgi:hypothetical protein